MNAYRCYTVVAVARSPSQLILKRRLSPLKLFFFNRLNPVFPVPLSALPLGEYLTPLSAPDIGTDDIVCNISCSDFKKIKIKNQK